MNVKLQDVKNKNPLTRDTWREKLSRKISVYFTWIFLNASLSPNNVTLIAFFFGFLSFVFFLSGNYFCSLFAIFFYQLHVIFDACDGEVARYKNKSSLKGVYLDLIGHVIINPLIILGIAIGAYVNNNTFLPSLTFLIFGFMGIIGYTINNFIKIKKYEVYLYKKEIKKLEEISDNLKKGFLKKNKSFLSVIKEEFLELFRKVIFNNYFLFGVFNILPLLVIILGIFYPLYAIKNFYFEFKNLD